VIDQRVEIQDVIDQEAVKGEEDRHHLMRIETARKEDQYHQSVLNRKKNPSCMK